jgi:hypothetical protein
MCIDMKMAKFDIISGVRDITARFHLSFLSYNNERNSLFNCHYSTDSLLQVSPESSVLHQVVELVALQELFSPRRRIQMK